MIRAPIAKSVGAMLSIGAVPVRATKDSKFISEKIPDTKNIPPRSILPTNADL